MKKICFLILLVLLSLGVSWAEVPDLVGTWTVSMSGYEQDMGYFGTNEIGVLNITVLEQTGRLFTGSLTHRSAEGIEEVEDFSGAIGLDNKTLYIAKADMGYDIGTVISEDLIELIYMGYGETATVAIDTLHRVRDI